MGMFGREKGDVVCPNCGESVHDALRCSHCGLRVKKHRFPRWLPYIAISLGVVFLLLWQKHADYRIPRTIHIGDISPRHNFSRVQVSGVLLDDTHILRNGTRFYAIDDGTGTLAVFDAATSHHSIPAKGASISAIGMLKVGAGNDRRMQADTLVVDSEIFLPTAGAGLKAIQSNDAGNQVTGVGRVVYIQEPRAGSKAPHKIILRDSGGSIAVVHWLKKSPQLKVGDVVEVAGTVSVYKGEVELKLTHAEDLRIIQ